MLNYNLTEEQQDIVKLARSFAKNEMIPAAEQYDESEKHPAEIVKKAWEVGLMNLSIPEEYGGPGLEFFTYCLVNEELCRGCAGISTIFNANTLANLPVIIGGSEEQKRRFLTPFTEAPILSAFGLTEPGSGSDAGAMQSTAVLKGDHYVLNGGKCFITNGAVASQFTIFASVDRSKGTRGVTAFVVPADTPGIYCGKKEKKLGIRASVTSEVIMEDLRVPKENLLLGEGKGMRLALGTLNKARISVASGAVGVSRRAFEEALVYSKQRVQFGRPICELQAIQHMLADMAISIQAMRDLYWRAAWMASNDLPCQKESAICKAFNTETGFQVVNTGLQIFGGYGYIREYPLEKLLRDIRIMSLVDGTTQIQKNILAGLLLSE
ncbi:MAG: acyl-CoA dehydrogenase [Firmicutes bacterium]|nr:acyl-CoA dehydrogenase [Bacillota bacterium]